MHDDDIKLNSLFKGGTPTGPELGGKIRRSRTQKRRRNLKRRTLKKRYFSLK